MPDDYLRTRGQQDEHMADSETNDFSRDDDKASQNRIKADEAVLLTDHKINRIRETNEKKRNNTQHKTYLCSTK
jgi:hypothetical protein